MRLRAPDGRTATVVRVCCRVCRDRHPDRPPGLLALVHFRHSEGDVVVARLDRQVTGGQPGVEGRAMFGRVEGFAQLECGSCPHRPRSHRDRLEVAARAELDRHGDRVYL